MPTKSKIKKTAPKRKVVRSKSKTNLLKNTNFLLLVGGIVVSILTISVLANNTANYDIRSQAQVLPSSAPSIAIPSGMIPIPSAVCLGGVCPGPDEEENNEIPGGHQPCDPDAGNCSNRGKDHNNDQNQDPDQNQEPDQDDPDVDNPDADDPDEGDADKGHGNDEDGVDEDNPGKGLGGPNAEKNDPEQGGFFEQLMRLIQQLIQQLFGGGQVPPVDNPNPVPSIAPSNVPSAAPSISPAP